jgi:PucR C-terminal helix-turn-helix domain/GGDEF-like domain
VARQSLSRNRLFSAFTNESRIRYGVRVEKGPPRAIAADLDAKIAQLARHLDGQVATLTEATFAYMHEERPAWMREQPLRDAVHEFTAGSIRAELLALRSGGDLPDQCPPVDAEGAREGARAGSPLSLFLDGYRAGHQAQWEAWFDLVNAESLAEDERDELLRRGSRFFFDYAARLTGFVTAEYMAERDRALRSAEQRRMRLVLRALDGEPVDTVSLDYPFDVHHIAIVASGQGVAEALRNRARELDRRSLVLEVGEGNWWAWLGGAAPLGKAEQRLELGRDLVIGIGIEAFGPDGFRRTHRQASRAHRVAIRTGAQAAHYRNLVLEDLASRDEEDARVFIASELRGIDGEDRRSKRLRSTLLAYFAKGQNAKVAAAHLGIHQQTVAQRLAAVEERIGQPIAPRRAELELALRLSDYLDEPTAASGE